MNTASFVALFFLVLLLIGILAAFRCQAMEMLALRLGLILLLTGIMAFAGFGFLAAGELAPSLAAWVWRIVYAGLGTASLIGVVRAARFRSTKAIQPGTGRS